ncbi:hypothetical protein [Listeria seeligeri]|uniref:DUF5082 domain-containing protein n=2 Tax=Listeria seeligeri TaxID=1640 RepID=A0ABR5EBV7_LISSE|nr:hypothetical protein [Listeria seeligeri]EFS04721.1 conserved hypothetical protein [Listeria seeligeri FSL S4-171]EFS01705.1 conserved hypothetical protein [Listeria seeligeri FSL N1-067]KKD50523.1 hypothetical protein UQ68_01435 [Listeria seeligeri]MBC1579067.1 hypothetical protein [Listeria seeligeri]MBC1586738.1 hypothetical protein [Listeria seeligeri]
MYGSSPTTQKIENYDYYVKAEQQRLQAKLDNKNDELSKQERADIIQAQRALEKQIQKQHLQVDVPKKVTKIIDEGKQELANFEQTWVDLLAEYADIVTQMECSFESKTGQALKDWMVNYRSNQIVQNENLIYDCQDSIKLDN